LKAYILAICSLLCVGLSTQSTSALAVATHKQNARAVIGTYNCSGYDGHYKWHFRSHNSAWGSYWVHVQTFYPPQHGAPADIGQTFIGFDRWAKRWNIVALDYAGTYYTRHSDSQQLNGSVWKDDYPSDARTAVVRVLSTTAYTFDLLPSSKNHATSLFHVLCLRAR
jgi:hypothetical protein